MSVLFTALSVLGLFLAAAFVLAVLFIIAIQGKYTVPIITYHKVREDGDSPADTVSPGNLRRQLEFIKKYGYRVIPLEELIEMIKAGRSLPRHTVVLTFDDGYKDNLANGLPILKEFGFPATFFVSPGTVDHDDYLNWDELRVMRDAGASFGSHGMTQGYLPDLKTADKKREIVESKRLLEQNLGVTITLFAYPVGGFDRESIEILKEAGYIGACTTNRGTDRFNRNIYELNRIRLSDRDVFGIDLFMKFSGFYNLFRGMKRPA